MFPKDIIRKTKKYKQATRIYTPTPHLGSLKTLAVEVYMYIVVRILWRAFMFFARCLKCEKWPKRGVDAYILTADYCAGRSFLIVLISKCAHL